LLGGSAAHFCMSARLFTDVHLVGIVGEDFPKKYIRFLRKRGVDLTSLIAREGKSFQWHGEYKDHDLNSAITLATEVGVLMDYYPQVAIHQRDVPNIFLANIDPNIQMNMLKLMKKPRLTGLDSMNFWIDNRKPAVKRLLKRVNLFVANDAEARALSGETNLVKAAKALRKMGPEFIIVKKGEHGVFFYCDQFMFSFPAYPVEHVVDPTGAGDTFAGGLMGYLTKTKRINEKAIREAVVYATTLASFNVEGFGMAKTANLTLGQVNKRKNHLIKHITP